jgi:caffeoyl-CoA O-methyltransferase
MDFLDPKLSTYAEEHTSPESTLLANINRDTYANVLIPRMLSGHLQGRTLSMLSKLMRPKTILEIGTYTGYSALCLAEGLQEGGMLHTIDINEELETRIRKFIDQSPFKDNIKLHIGNAMDIVPTIAGDIDMVFIDADKENYSNYYKLLIDRLPSGAVLIADNVLWSGKVIDEDQLSNDVETQQLNAFNKMVHEDPRVENVLLPIRDGLMIVRKK